MIFELLIGLLLQTSAFPKIDTSSFFKSEINTARPATPTKPTFSYSPKPTSTSTPTPTPSSTSSPAGRPSSTTTPPPTQSQAKLTTKSVLKALNDYRAKKGVSGLALDSTLQSYAQSRADYLKSIGKLDNHAKHKEFMSNNGFAKLGFNSVAENQGSNYKGDAKGLIESFYGKSSGHNKNQLNPVYTHVGIGINSPFTNLVFGGRKR